MSGDSGTSRPGSSRTPSNAANRQELTLFRGQLPPFAPKGYRWVTERWINPNVCVVRLEAKT